MIAQIILIITLANLLLSMSQQNLRATQEEVVYADAATNKSELTFFLLGDWGKGGLSGNVGGKNKKDKKNRHKARKLPNDNDNEHNQHDQKDESTYQVQIARAMGNLSSEDPPQFVIALGDNFYDDGVSSVNDTLWNSLWKDIYIKNFTGLNIPWYGVLGNHDYGSGTNGVKAQVARTSFGDDDFWTMPDTNYSKTFGIPNTNDSVMFVFCDTTTLAPSENECCNEEGGVSMSMQQYLISNQVQHLTRLLSDAREKNPSWLFVAGHYPIYSAGSHGDTSELLYYLLPLLKTYKVDAYFCGHDHISEHLEKDGIHFFVVGAGSMTDNIEQESNANLLWYGVKYSAFASMAVSNSMMNITYIDLNGTVRYNYTIEREGSTFEENTINQSDDDVSSFKVANKWFQDIFGNSSPRAKYFVAGSTMILVLLIVFLGFVRFAKTYPKPMAKNIRLLRSNPLKSAHPTATTATSNISTDTEEAEIATAYKRYFGNSSTYQRLSGGSAYQPDTFPRRFNETPEKLQVQRSATGRILYGHNRSISDRAVNYFGRSTHYQTETANRTNIDVRALKIAEEDDYADLINKTTEL